MYSNWSWNSLSTKGTALPFSTQKKRHSAVYSAKIPPETFFSPNNSIMNRVASIIAFQADTNAWVGRRHFRRLHDGVHVHFDRQHLQPLPRYLLRHNRPHRNRTKSATRVILRKNISSFEVTNLTIRLFRDSRPLTFCLYDLGSIENSKLDLGATYIFTTYYTFRILRQETRLQQELVHFMEALRSRRPHHCTEFQEWLNSRKSRMNPRTPPTTTCWPRAQPYKSHRLLSSMSFQVVFYRSSPAGPKRCR